MADQVTPFASELTTANYGWVKPTVGASTSVWGGYINSDLDGIDGIVHGIDTTALRDAPNDGTLYGRKSAGWSRLTHNDITDWAASAYVLPTASTTVLGGVMVDGTTVTISSGKISAPFSILICNNRSALAAVDTTKFTSVFLTEAGREGLFTFKTGNYSTQIAADVQQGVFVQATAIPATAGSWVRIVTGYLVPEWFGALKNGSNDDSIAINAASQIASNLLLPLVVLSGTYTTANSIVPVTGVILRGSGAWTRINVNTNVAVALSQANAPLIHGGLENIKFFNASPTNANAVGLQLDACQRCTFKDLDFFNYDAGTFAMISPTVVYNSGNAAIYGQDYQNFVFNTFENIMVSKCSFGMVFRGGGQTWNATVTNVVTQNVYRNVCLRQVTSTGIYSDFWHDNDHFYDTFIEIVADRAAAILLSANDPTAYRGVSAHHFFGTTIVRDPTVTWTQMYGVALKNASGCLFVGLGSDTTWQVAGEFFSNPIPVEAHVLSSYMHFPSAYDTTGDQQSNRLANITQNTLTRQSASVTVTNGLTSLVVTFPKPLYIAPVAGKGEIRLTPLMDPGVRYWVDYTTITTTGFTMRFSAAVPTSFPMLWTAEVFAVS